MTPCSVAYCLQLQGAKKKTQDLNMGGNIFLQNVGIYIISQKAKAPLREATALLSQGNPIHNLQSHLFDILI
jgi:hypothetical protein